MTRRRSGHSSFTGAFFLVLLVPCCLQIARSQGGNMHQSMMQDSAMSMDMEMGAGEMPSFVMPSLPMARDGSGTSWLPDNSPVHAVHNMYGLWNAMLHGEATLRYVAQDAFQNGSRGGSRWGGPNWVMGMLSRRLGDASQIGFRLMMSLDRLTEGGAGYPLLFQTGESWNGHRLVDTQHPHDLFMELATSYSFQLSEESALGLYLAYPGEPALGPPTFMHRPSARSLIDAPLSHHWQDATHISFGVATFGWQYRTAKLEGSVFTGREPDENRWNVDRPTFDSYSVRISCNPTDALAFQISRGFLKGPEPLEPGVDQWRTTASVLYRSGSDPDHPWNSAAVWGLNTLVGDKSQGSFLVESTFGVGPQAVFGRFEAVQKSAEELDLGQSSGGTFSILALTVGTSRTVLMAGSVDLSVGIQATFHRVETGLQAMYGKAPVSLEVFLSVGPSLMTMSHAQHHTY